LRSARAEDVCPTALLRGTSGVASPSRERVEERGKIMPESERKQDSLEIREPAVARHLVTLQRRPMIIGREPRPASDIWLADPTISRRHAQLQMTDEGLWALQDLGSQNGTFVNGRRVSYALLVNGDRIRVGDCELILRVGAPQEEEEPFLAFEPVETIAAEERPSWEMLGRYVELVRQLDHVDEVEPLMDSLATGCLAMCSASLAAVGLFEGDRFRWYACASEEGMSVEAPSLSDLICQRLRLESLTFERVQHTGDVKRYEAGHPPGGLLFPLRSAGKTRGILFLDLGPSARPLQRQGARLVRLAAMAAANRLSHFEGRQAAEERDRLASSLDAARRIQANLFPRTLDVDPRLEVGAVNLPSTVVSGDYYDVMKTDADRALFVISDAMGCGLPAALLMANFQAGFRLAPHVGPDIRRVHTILGELVEANSGGSAFVTGVLGALDLRSGFVTLTIAGHLPPLRIAGGRALAISRRYATAPWGMPWSQDVDLFQASLAQGSDILVFCTDGVTEAENSAGDQLGMNRFLDIAGRTAFGSLQEAVEGISQEVMDWCGRSLADDLTLMAIRWRG
jgi:serine phosphatase RsbU (regulator of sigma subunit)